MLIAGYVISRVGGGRLDVEDRLGGNPEEGFASQLSTRISMSAPEASKLAAKSSLSLHLGSTT